MYTLVLYVTCSYFKHFSTQRFSSVYQTQASYIKNFCIQNLAPRMHHPESMISCPVSIVRYGESGIQSPLSISRQPKLRIQGPASCMCWYLFVVIRVLILICFGKDSVQGFSICVVRCV